MIGAYLVRAGGVATALTLLAALSLAPPGARAEVLAVVVGIDEYAHVTDLDGAVADARDLERTFAWLGARTALVLDRAADRETLFGLLDDALSSAGPDDVIVFSFAGHGIQVPDRGGDEADGFDEAYVLSGYRPGALDWEQLILDDELDELVRRAAPTPVVLLADSCHSGTMLRGRDQRADFRKVRALPRASFGSGPVSRPSRPRGERAPEAAPNLVFFGAVPEELGVQEVLIDGQARGALSYAFARGLEGAADRNGDKLVTSDELVVQVAERVRVLSSGRQTPAALAAPDARRRLVFRLPGGTGSTSGAQPESSPTPTSTTASSERERLRVAVRGAAGDRRALFAGIHGIEIVAAPERADLILDAPSGDILTSSGDVAARLGPARDRRLMQGIVDKWRLLKELGDAVDGTLEARVLPQDQLFRNGAPFALRIKSHSHGHLVLFDLASDGSLLALHPGPAGPPPRLAAGDLLEVGLRAGPPFGADHLIAALLPAERLPPLLDLLADTHGRPLSSAQARQLAGLLDGAAASLPVVVYTAP